ncbi:MAG: Uma2 family endonuclease [Leptolyngbyaceae cyanobacterium SM2_5_2]|nr:Uma2 family endonuclease [Leptolyngbyaceae cyanobacterium SM2_5_2]
MTTNHQNLPTIAPYRWTVERYHRAIEAGIFDGQPLELLNGVLIEMSPEGIPHAGLSSDAADYLREQLGTRAKVRDAKPITLPDDSEPEPDIAIVKPLGDLYKTERHPHAEDIFWLIEYANSSLEKDLELKDKIYAAANISEYWVVNLKIRELIVFRAPVDGQYRSQHTLTSGTLCPVSFPTIQLEIARLVQ